MKEKIITQKPLVTYDKVIHALDTLKEYKRAKLSLEDRITGDELWWRLRQCR